MVSEISYPSTYQIVPEGKILIHDNELSKTKDYYYLELGLHHSITDMVEAMNSLVQTRKKLQHDLSRRESGSQIPERCVFAC